jgi:hypothetical protein
MFGEEGQVMEWVYLLALAQEGASVGCEIHNRETLVWMFCGLRNAVKKLCGDLLVVHQRKCTWGKMETLVA